MLFLCGNGIFCPAEPTSLRGGQKCFFSLNVLMKPIASPICLIKVRHLTRTQDRWAEVRTNQVRMLRMIYLYIRFLLSVLSLQNGSKVDHSQKGVAPAKVHQILFPDRIGCSVHPSPLLRCCESRASPKGFARAKETPGKSSKGRV